MMIACNNYTAHDDDCDCANTGAPIINGVDVESFRGVAYMVGDFLSAAICEVAMGRSASALEAVAQLNKFDRVEFALICGDEHGAAKAKVAVARWIADAAAQVAS